MACSIGSTFHVETPVLHVVLEVSVGGERSRDRLTHAEREVLARIVAGQGNGEIAAARRAALRTVANQVASLLRKLRIASRHEVLPAVMKRSIMTRSERAACDTFRFVFEHAGDRYALALHPASVASCAPLGAREQAVVERVARGMSDKEIAYELGVAVGSVSTLLWRVRQRTGLGGRSTIAVSWLASHRIAS